MVLQTLVWQFDMVAATEWTRNRLGQSAAHLLADERVSGRGLKPSGLPNCDRSRTIARFSVQRR